MTAARLAVAVLATLALAPAAHARADAPRLTAPQGLRAFLLRADEPKTDVYPRTPSFAWQPVARTLRYEFQLSTSNQFRDSGIVYSSKQLKTPAIAVPISLPWITGKPYALYARARAVTQGGTTPWTPAYGFNMRWPSVPEPMSTFPGLLRWTPIAGATAYEVWFGTAQKVIKRIRTATNVADQRDHFTLRPWTSTLQWRIRAVRELYGTRANSLPAVSYGPWSQTYTSVNPPFATGPLATLATVSDTVTDATTETEAHRLMPGFVFTGNRTMFSDDVELYRMYAFTDSDCVNTVFVGSVVGSPAFAPRTSGMLKLPTSSSASAPSGYLPDTTDAVKELMLDETPVTPNEVATTPTESPAPAEEEPEAEEGEGEKTETPATAQPAADPALPALATPVPPVDLWDTEWPEGGYYWTVVGVETAQADPVETELTANAPVGATTIVVASAADLEIGNVLEIGLAPNELATISAINGTTITLASALTGPHFAGEEVKRSDDTVVYRDAELPQDVCAAGRVQRFGKMSEPAVAIAGAPLASGLSTNGRLISATRTQSVFYGAPVVAWNPAAGAHAYEVQWSAKADPFKPAAKSILTYSTSAVLPLKPGTWHYRVRGLNLALPKGAQPLSWSDPVRIVVAKPRFSIVK